MPRYCSRCHTPYDEDERFCPLDGGAVLDGGPTADPLIGQTLQGRYLLKRAIGRGGMGVVYEAEHVGLGKRVAVKLLLDDYSEDREVLTRFHQEARTASMIGHENIIDILDIGDHAGRSFITMEFLEGSDLRRTCQDLGEDERLPIGRAIAIVKQVCRALAAAHAKGIIHRDMKPENVFLTTRGDRADFVKLMDFGISKIKAAHDSEVRLTQTGAVIGTPLYMAPEQALGQSDIDHRVDIYAVGIMLFEILCGRPPFDSQSYVGLLTQHVHEPPPPPRELRPEVPVSVERAILTALAKDRGDRFQTIDAFAAALPDNVPAFALSPSRAKLAKTNAKTLAKGESARRGPIAAIGGGLLVVGVVATILVTQGKNKHVTPPSANVVVSSAPIPSSAAASSGAGNSLAIATEPPAAHVLLDGLARCVTPCTINDIAPGPHKLRIELDGYQPLEMDKKVEGSVEESYHLTRDRSGHATPPKPAAPPAATSVAASAPAIVVQPPPVVQPPVVQPAATSAPVDHKKNPYDHKTNPYGN